MKHKLPVARDNIPVSSPVRAPVDTRFDYDRHWCPRSEIFSGGDSLISALVQGWQLEPTALRDAHVYGGRVVIVYHFYLTRGSQTQRMRVVSNPYVEKLVVEHGLRLICPRQVHGHAPTHPEPAVRERT